MFENGMRPARDPKQAPEPVQRAAREAAEKADRQTRAFKGAATRSANASRRPSSSR